MKILILVFGILSSMACLAQTFCSRSLIVPAKKYDSAPRVVIVSGTNREQSNSLLVSLEMKAKLEDEGAFVEILDLAQVPPSTYSGKNYFNTPRSFQEKYDQKITKADHLVIVVPEYHGSFPGILKSFFDYVQSPLEAKNISLIGISAGAWGARSALNQFSETLLHRKANLWGASRINIPGIDKLMESGRLRDPILLERMKKASELIVSSKESVASSESLSFSQIQSLTGLKRKARYQLSSGLVVEGVLSNVTRGPDKEQLAYAQFQGPTSLKDGNRPLLGQGEDIHAQGFGTPLGKLKKYRRLSGVRSVDQLAKLGLKLGTPVLLEFESGVVVDGVLESAQFSLRGTLQILQFSSCRVSLGENILFDPKWGTFDMAVAEKIQSVLL